MSQSYQNAFILQSFGLDAPQASRPRSVAPPDAQAGSRATSASWGVPRRAFSADPPQLPRQFNDDGSENLEWARHQSALRLRTKWEGIYDRFKDAHLEDQDEIYLGRASITGDEPRIIRDRGSLRALDKQLRFGSFIRDEELQAFSVDEGAEDEGATWDADAPADGPDDTHSWVPYSKLHAAPPPAGGDDPELQEFLRQEARRRQLYGSEDELEDVVDLHGTQLHRPRKERRRPAPEPAGFTEVRAPSPDIAEELDIYQSVKREAIESMLRSNTLGVCSLPYDISGLSDVLSGRA